MLKGLMKEVVLIFDADTAGGAATERGIGLLLDAGMRVRVVELPEGEDPASFLQQHSGADFLRWVEEGRSFLDYLVQRAKRSPDFHTPTGQADCVARILPLLCKIDDHVERWGYTVLLAEQLGLPPDILQRQMQPKRDGKTRRWGDLEMRRGRAKEMGRQQLRQPSSAVSLSLTTASTSPQPEPREEYCLIQELCHDLRFLTRVQQQITADAFRNEDLRAIFVTLVQLAPQCQGTAFSQLLHAIDQPRQKQIVSQMAVESFVSSDDERAKAVADCLTKMQRQHMKAQRQRVIDQLHTANDEAKRHLLQEFRRLQQKGGMGGNGAVRPL
jgi:DNA primase